MRVGPQNTIAGGTILLLAFALTAPVNGAEDDASAAAAAADVSAPPAASGNASTVRSRPEGATQQNVVHPLDPVLRQATVALQRFDQQIRDYECLMIKRERITGQLTPHQFLRLKVRERQQQGDQLETPFSVYARFLKPKSVEGRELLYVENQRNGDLLARRGGPQLPNLTLQLDPRGTLAMSESRYPITHIGIRNLITQMIERVEEQMEHGDCDVQFFDEAKLDGRPCEHIVVRQRSSEHPFHTVRVLIDKQLRLPVYFASYSWPDASDGQPVLEEEYVYTKLKLNPGFSDLDFDRENPHYRFLKLAPEQTAAK